MIERRAEHRILDDDLVLLGWREDAGKSNQLANVSDVSPCGMRVLVGDALPVGKVVTVTYGEGELTGIVRHNTATAEGTQIGIEFVGSSRNSTLHFQPELLLGED